ncbi:MAG: 3H domain-containing protein [Chloroflexota bacterium]
MSEERRQRILKMLSDVSRPLSGTELAQQLNISRQTVVQDISLLRARGEPIVATARGYLMATALLPSCQRALLAVKHAPEETEEELSLLLDMGLRVVDVQVDHPVYGEIRGMLMLDSRDDLREWLKEIRQKRVRLLSELTEGVHLHTVEAPRADLLERARTALRERGFLFEE